MIRNSGFRQRQTLWQRFLLLAGITLSVYLTPLTQQTAAQSTWFATTDPHTPADEQRLLHVPPGFKVELVTAEPDIAKPINLNFDQRGRLWMTCSVEYPIPAPPDRKPRDSVKILEDSDGNGTFDKISTFADGLNIPIGVLPITIPGPNGKRLQAAIVHSIPNIYLLVDEDGDGRADRRDVLYGTFGSDDTHGMTGSFTWGFDGWVYAHHGFANTSRVSAADGSRIVMQSGNTYRFRPDGSHIEQNTWGQVNPFGICFDPLGNLYAADCHSRPAYLLLRGAYYPSFGKPDDGLGFGPELMSHDHGSTAICGISYYAAKQFPPEYRDTLFIGNVVTNRINHDKFTRSGSTYRAIEQPDFLTSDDPWFRPVDIQLGPDGALYVADFYNRVIAHVEVPLTHPGRDHISGRVWKIYWQGTKGEHTLPAIPDFTKLGIDELVDRLGDDNLTNRTLVASELVLRNKDQIRSRLQPILDQHARGFARVHATWVLERLGLLTEESLLRLTTDAEPSVRTHAMRVLSERQRWSPKLASRARAALQDADGFVQRAAADALGRHPSKENFHVLLDARGSAPTTDPFLVHTIRMALRDQLRPSDNWQEMTGELTEAEARSVADVALGVPTTSAADFLLPFLNKYAESPDLAARHMHHIARYGRSEQTFQLLAFIRAAQDDAQRASLLRAFVQAMQERGDTLDDEVLAYVESQVSSLLATQRPESLEPGIELAGLLKMRKAEHPLTLLVKKRDLPESLRKSAASSLVLINPQVDVKLLSGLLTDADEPAGIREHAAKLLAASDRPEPRQELFAALPAAPFRLQAIIAVEIVKSRQGIDWLLEAIAAGKAPARLLQEREIEFWLGRSGRPEVKKRIEELTAGLPPEDERLQQLINRRRKEFAKGSSDPLAGARIFAKHCGICHQVANQGAKIGPQLDGIGARGLERLLEDVLDPSRNVDQAFRSSIIVLNDGRTIVGNVLREEGQIIVLADQEGKEVRVSKADIDEQQPSRLSLMPSNVTEQIVDTDFRDLLSYLLTLRAKPVAPSVIDDRKTTLPSSAPTGN